MGPNMPLRCFLYIMTPWFGFPECCLGLINDGEAPNPALPQEPALSVFIIHLSLLLLDHSLAGVLWPL